MKKMIIFWTGSQIKRINKTENSNPDENTCNSNGNIYGHIYKQSSKMISLAMPVLGRS